MSFGSEHPLVVAGILLAVVTVGQEEKSTVFSSISSETTRKTATHHGNANRNKCHMHLPRY